jgi:hypothetical protein
MPTQSKPVASPPATNRPKRSTVQPLRVTVHYLSFPPLKRTVPTPPAWLGAAYGVDLGRPFIARFRSIDGATVNLKRFRRPTAQAVLGYRNEWEDSYSVSILFAVLVRFSIDF